MTTGLTHGEAVLAAYGWKLDLSDEKILGRSLAFGSFRFASHSAGTAALRRARGVLRKFGESVFGYIKMPKRRIFA